MPSGRLALFYWSGGVWFVLGVTLLPISQFGLLILDFAFALKFDLFGIGSVLAIVAAALCLLLFAVTRRSFARRLRAHWLAVCPTCLYPLKMEMGRCPECGRRVTRREARMFWFGILFSPMNVLKSESKVLRDGQIWRDQRRDRVRLNNWRFGPLARRQRASPGPPSSMS